ncbi:unnamed protein product [Cylicostephanus goldi]|uniref:Uncharacterized protein n=1 Tax=Cylicostephanus goldi TaxID=71465 RepID=A0A3P6TU60_CYLGO|nr:unnamed protein product [Cylicostephanus goldi]
MPVLIFALDFDVSEDEPIEGCNLEEDNCFTEKFEQQLMSTSKLSDIREEKEEIEFRGLEDEPDDYSYLFDNAETNNVLNEPQPNFYYEIPEDEHTDMARYTLEEMEELFASFNDLII